MIGIDTNILIYARLARAPRQARAAAFLEGLAGSPDVVIAELILVELYLALRNPAVLNPPLDAPAAAAECGLFRRHPRWALAEDGSVMDEVWRVAARPGFARRRIIDVRLAHVLLAHEVAEFATANVRDFEGLGFERVWDPLE